jgi:hypothetical protein
LNNLCEFSVTGTVETVVKKLSKANIAAYNVKKRENVITFQVNDESIKKVFAIFKHPCYNINIRRKSKKTKFLQFLTNRVGLIIGGVLFVVAVALSNSFVFKIQVTGSGSYLKSQVLEILADCGVSNGKYLKSFEKPLAQSRIMALPNVTFCSISRAGSALIVDVQTDEVSSRSTSYSPLVCDKGGTLKNLVVVCGTAEVTVGSIITSGQTLIGAYKYLSNGEKTDCLAVGYAELECTEIISVSCESDSEENAVLALNSTLLYSDRVTAKSLTKKVNGDGVVYEVTFSYLYRLSINIE